jgi:integrase
VSLDAGTVEELRRWRAVQNEERLVMGAGWPKADLVFTHPDGSGLWPQTVTRQFREIAGRVELPEIGVHGLRHTAATWMISQGISPKVVAERLGHAHVSITLGLYTHVLPAHDRAAAEAFAGALTTSSTAVVTNL